MSNNTEIHKHEDYDIDKILNVGRTNDGEIYIDIRVYRTGDVIEVGDITITQQEWDQISGKLVMVGKDQKLFVCPECGDIVTESEILESLTTGGFGMCLCLFGNGQRTLVRYEPYVREVLELTPDEVKLVRSLRRLREGRI